MEAISSPSLLPPGSLETVNPSGLPLHITFGDGSNRSQLRQIYLKNFVYQILENV